MWDMWNVCLQTFRTIEYILKISLLSKTLADFTGT